MEKRRLGNSELYVNPIGLGCMGLSHASGDPTERGVAVKVLREAYEMGYDLFDTAEAFNKYSKRHNKFVFPALAEVIYGSTCKAENEISNVVNYRCIQ